MAVALIGVGALLLWSAIQDVPVLDALRSLARGEKPVKVATPWVNKVPGFSNGPDGTPRDYPKSYNPLPKTEA